MSSIAHELAKKQKEISVSEFFEKNKQILGFDSLTRALITSVKEAVDKYGCGTASVSEVCGLTDLHHELRRRIAGFTAASLWEAA